MKRPILNKYISGCSQREYHTEYNRYVKDLEKYTTEVEQEFQEAVNAIQELQRQLFK